MAAILLLVLGWLLREPLFRGWRRRRIRAQAFPPEWRRILRQRVPLVAGLPADLQLQLKKHIQVFLAEKPFIGCAGLEVTDEMRVVVAAQACLLLLDRRTDHFAATTQVLLYPGAFLVERERTDALGLAHRDRRALSGESWSAGQVILSWDDVVQGAADPHDGRNVVIHEFAHRLDQDNGGVANGAPALGGQRRRERWARVMHAEYTALQERLARGQPGAIDPYAASDPAEFFAVISEMYFEQPSLLAELHPDLFQQLMGCYRVDPRDWHAPSGGRTQLGTIDRAHPAAHS
jgi:Mlc titration factor MtfA (ptsG expression regulator)